MSVSSWSSSYLAALALDPTVQLLERAGRHCSAAALLQCAESLYLAASGTVPFKQ